MLYDSPFNKKMPSKSAEITEMESWFVKASGIQLKKVPLSI